MNSSLESRVGGVKTVLILLAELINEFSSRLSTQSYILIAVCATIMILVLVLLRPTKIK